MNETTMKMMVDAIGKLGNKGADVLMLWVGADYFTHLLTFVFFVFLVLESVKVIRVLHSQADYNARILKAHNGSFSMCERECVEICEILEEHRKNK